MAKYKCPTLGDCDHANRGEIFERAPGEDLKCPGCNTLLNPVAAPDGGSRGASRTPLIAAGADVVVNNFRIYNIVIGFFSTLRTLSTCSALR